MEYPEMRNTAFGEVLAELLEKRGVEITPFKVGKLAEDAGLDATTEAPLLRDLAAWTDQQPPQHVHHERYGDKD